LAEIFNSGILRKTKPKPQDEKKRPIDENDNDVEYEFIAADNFDIRRWLLGQRSKAKTEKVEELIEELIEERLPGGALSPILDDEGTEDDVIIGDLTESVKSSSSARWKRLGHYDIVKRLESAFIQEKEKSASNQPTNSEVPTGNPLTTKEQNVQRVFGILESKEKYLHIYGPHGIGKTRFVKRLLKEFPRRSAYIDVAGNEQVLDLLRKAYSALYSESEVVQLYLAEIAQHWAEKVQARSASYDVIVLDHFDRLLAPPQMADELRKTILPALEKNICQFALPPRFIIVAQTKIEVLCERNYPDLIKNWAVSS
jgi:Cdc6-like AAA superfamily ATPase